MARLLEEEAEDVRLVMTLAGAEAAAASGGRGSRPGPRSPRYPLTETLRHVQKDLRAMPIGDSVSQPPETLGNSPSVLRKFINL